MPALARRRWHDVLGAPAVLGAPLVLALALSPAAAAEEAELVEPCTSGAQHEVYIDDVLQPRCEMLFGDLDVRGRNADWRLARIMSVESGSRTLDVIHTDAQLKRPQVRSLAGMVVAETFAANVIEEDCSGSDEGDESADGGEGDEIVAEEPGSEVASEYVARVELNDHWAALCEADTIVLRVDDAIGASGRVLHIDRRGVLAHLGGRLVWLSRSGLEAPAFRTTWQSDFSVITDTKASKPAKKKKPRRKRKKRRR